MGLDEPHSYIDVYTCSDSYGFKINRQLTLWETPKSSGPVGHVKKIWDTPVGWKMYMSVSQDIDFRHTLIHLFIDFRMFIVTNQYWLLYSQFKLAQKMINDFSFNLLIFCSFKKHIRCFRLMHINHEILFRIWIKVLRACNFFSIGILMHYFSKFGYSSLFSQELKHV